MIQLIALEVLGQAWLVLFGVVIILGLAVLFGKFGFMSPINTRPADTRKLKDYGDTMASLQKSNSILSDRNLALYSLDTQMYKEIKSLEAYKLDTEIKYKPRIVVASLVLGQVREYLQSIGNLSQEQASLLSSVKQSLNFINEDRPDMATIKKAITAGNVAREFRQAYGSAKESFTPVNWIEEANKIDPSTQQKLYYGIDLSEGEAAKVQRLYSGNWEYNDAPHDPTGSDPIFEKEMQEAGKAAKLNFEPVVDFQKIPPIKGDNPTRRWTSGGSHLQNVKKPEALRWWLGLDEDVQASLGDRYNLTPESVISESDLAKMHKDWLCGQSPLKCSNPDCSVCYADRNASNPEAETDKEPKYLTWWRGLSEDTKKVIVGRYGLEDPILLSSIEHAYKYEVLGVDDTQKPKRTTTAVRWWNQMSLKQKIEVTGLSEEVLKGPVPVEFIKREFEKHNANENTDGRA